MVPNLFKCLFLGGGGGGGGGVGGGKVLSPTSQPENCEKPQGCLGELNRMRLLGETFFCIWPRTGRQLNQTEKALHNHGV